MYYACYNITSAPALLDSLLPQVYATGGDSYAYLNSLNLSLAERWTDPALANASRFGLQQNDLADTVVASFVREVVLTFSNPAFTKAAVLSHRSIQRIDETLRQYMGFCCRYSKLQPRQLAENGALLADPARVVAYLRYETRHGPPGTACK